MIVATPSGTHADITVPALEAGKHGLGEKPLDVTLAAADRIIEAERRTGNLVAVIYTGSTGRPSGWLPQFAPATSDA